MRPGFGEVRTGLSADKEPGVHGLRNVLGFGKMTTAILENGMTDCQSNLGPQRVREYLRSVGVDALVTEMPTTTRTAKEAAKVIG